MKALRLQLPTSWAHLKPRHLLFISRLLTVGGSPEEVKLKTFLFITRLRILVAHGDGPNYFTHHAIRKPFIIDPDVLASILNKLNFIFEPGEIHPPRFIGLARACHFRLYNATFEEYLMAENYYFAYVETKNTVHLFNLVATLYCRPWERFNTERIERRARRFRRTDSAIINAVFMWYIGFRDYVPRRCKALFGKPASGKPFNARNYLNGMVHQLNNGDITLNDRLMHVPVWDALDELEQRALAADALIDKSNIIT